MEAVQQPGFLSAATLAIATTHCHECHQKQGVSTATPTENAALLLSASVTSYISLLLTESHRVTTMLQQLDRTLEGLLENSQENALENMAEESIASEKSHRFQDGHHPAIESHEAQDITLEEPSVDADIDQLAKSLITLLQKENAKQYVRKRDHDIPFPFFGY